MKRLFEDIKYCLKYIGILFLIRLGVLVALILITRSVEFTSDMKYFPDYMIDNIFPFYFKNIILVPGGFGDWAPLSFAFNKLFVLPFLSLNNHFVQLRLAFMMQELLVFIIWLCYLRARHCTNALIGRFCLAWYLLPCLFLTNIIWGQEEYISCLFITLISIALMEKRFLLSSLFVGLGFLTAKVWVAFLWLVILFRDPKKIRHLWIMAAVGAAQAAHMIMTYRAHGFIPLIQYGNKIHDLLLESSLPALIYRLLWPAIGLKTLLVASQLATVAGVIFIVFYFTRRRPVEDPTGVLILIYLYFYIAFYLVTADYLVWIMPLIIYEFARRYQSLKYALSLSFIFIFSSLPWLFKLLYSNYFSIVEKNQPLMSFMSYRTSDILATATLFIYISALAALFVFFWLRPEKNAGVTE
jgi:hypothetical protein